VLDYQANPVGYIHRLNMGTVNNRFCDKLYIDLAQFLHDQIENFNTTHRLIHLMKLEDVQKLEEERRKLRQVQIKKAQEWITFFHPTEA
jgi:hypothetical protein